MFTSRPVWDKTGQRRRLQVGKEGHSTEDKKMRTNKYGDKQRQEKVRKGKGIHSVRNGFLNVPNTSGEQLGIMGEKEGERKRKACAGDRKDTSQA